MRRITLVSIAVVSASASGCASMSSDAARDDRGIDLQKVSAVDTAARSRNLEVRWVNYPRRRPATATETVPGS